MKTLKIFTVILAAAMLLFTMGQSAFAGREVGDLEAEIDIYPTAGGTKVFGTLVAYNIVTEPESLSCLIPGSEDPPPPDYDDLTDMFFVVRLKKGQEKAYAATGMEQNICLTDFSAMADAIEAFLKKAVPHMPPFRGPEGEIVLGGEDIKLKSVSNFVEDTTFYMPPGPIPYYTILDFTLAVQDK